MTNKLFCLVGAASMRIAEATKNINIPHVTKLYTGCPPVHGGASVEVSESEYWKMEQEGLILGTTRWLNGKTAITQGELFELEKGPMLCLVDKAELSGLEKNMEKIQGYEAAQLVKIYIHTDAQLIEEELFHSGQHNADVRKVIVDHAHQEAQKTLSYDYIIQDTSRETVWMVKELLEILISESLFLD